MTTDTTLIQRIKDLTARFGKGWHDGIQIDASDIADLCLAADALEQQAAHLSELQASYDRIEMAEYEMNQRLEQQAAQIEALRADAERYRWLRRTTNAVTSKGERIDVRNNPDLWDAAIDAALRQEQPHG